MTISAKPEITVEPVAVDVTDDTLRVDLSDGRSIAVPTAWFPRLVHGTPAERRNVQLGPSGIHWPDLNEDIPVAGLLNGEKSGESLRSIQRWLDLRSGGVKEPIPHLPLPQDLDTETQ